MSYNETMQPPADEKILSRRARWLTPGRTRILGWRIFLTLIALAAAYGGIKLRLALYADSQPFRFEGDIANGWHQGTEVYRQADAIRYARLHDGATTKPSLRNSIEFIDYFAALRSRYETLRESSTDEDYRLDYPPIRLLIMSSWVWENRRSGLWPIPKPSDATLARPLLRLNTTFEALAAIAAFLIVRRVLTLDGSKRATTCGLAAALLVWFNPAALLDGHVWPQWDVWILPFYLWGCWFALRGKWLICGALLALGAMCKGQLLLIAPALIFWPLLGGRWRAALDLLLGFFAAGLIVAVPWMLNDSDAVRLFVQLIGPTLLAVCLTRRIRLRKLLTAWVVLLLFCGLGRGSMAWYLVGFAYGARHLQGLLHIGIIPNLAAVLANQYGWRPQDIFVHAFKHDITTREFLLILNLLGSGVCGAALALQSRRQDRRILLALALPWLCAVCLLPQMHERYLLWASVTTALAAGVSLGMTLMHVAVALWAAVPIAVGLLEQIQRDKTAPATLATVDRWHTLLHNSWPGNAWSVLTLLLIWMYLALTPSRSVRSAVTLAERRDVGV